MASTKPPKTELVAICKLEFYRKQKNWKFSQDRKAKDSKRRNKAANAKLNQTYNIAPAPKKEPPHPETPGAEKQQNLNEAFVETETGTLESDEPVLEGQELLKDALDPETEKPSSQLDPLRSPYSPRWSIQRWAEQHRLWDPEPPRPTLDPLCPTLDPLCPTLDLPCPTLDPTCPTRDDLTFPQIQDTNCPIFDNNFNKIQQDIYSGQTNSNYPIFDKNYPPPPITKHMEQFDPKYGASLFYYNSNMCYHDFDVPYVGANVPMFRQSEMLNVPQSEVDVLNVCGEWDDEWCAGEGLWGEPEWMEEVARGAGAGAGGEDGVDGPRHHLSSVSCCDSLPSVTSSEFVRGAALAPHSTQIDLLLGPEPACALTGRALAAAVARHSAALRELLQEAQRRQQEALQPPDLYKYAEGPAPAHRPLPPRPPRSLPAHDVLLAASRAAPDLRGHTGQGGWQGHAGQTCTQEHAGQSCSQGHAGQSCSQGHAGQSCTQEHSGQSCPQGHPGQSCSQGQEGGRGRGRPKVGIRMGRPYRL